MLSLKSTLMERDEISSEEADNLIREARDAVWDGEDPEEILYEWFGLEPDFVIDLL